MKGILDRIKDFIDYKRLSIRKFESSINCTNGILSTAIRKKTDIQSKWLPEILYNYPELNSEWLLTGKGEMIKSSKNTNDSKPPIYDKPESKDEIQRLREDIMRYREDLNLFRDILKKEQLQEQKKI